tara:strand:- start:127 stop:300 length:174 start_codon:yes stop_codon:yes gene_type:complete
MADFLAIRRQGTFLQRKPSALRMHDRDTAGGRINPHANHKKKKKIHIKKNWSEDLWD